MHTVPWDHEGGTANPSWRQVAGNGKREYFVGAATTAVRHEVPVGIGELGGGSTGRSTQVEEPT